MCRAVRVGLRGGLIAFDADGVKSPLIVRGEGDRDYDSHSHVADHEGPVTIENFPLEMLENVRGNVSLTVSAYMGDQMSTTCDGYKVMSVDPADFESHAQTIATLMAISQRCF